MARKILFWTVGIIGVIAILGTVFGEEPAPVAPAAVAEPTEELVEEEPIDLEVTPEMVVDAMPAKAIKSFCTEYFTIADYDTAFKFFAKGYGEEAGLPSAEAVFDEVLIRCAK